MDRNKLQKQLSEVNAKLAEDNYYIIFRVANTKGNVAEYYYTNYSPPSISGGGIPSEDFPPPNIVEKNIGRIAGELMTGSRFDDLSEPEKIARSEQIEDWFDKNFAPEATESFLQFVKLFRKAIADTYPDYIIGDLLIPDDWKVPVLDLDDRKF